VNICSRASRRVLAASGCALSSSPARCRALLEAELGVGVVEGLHDLRVDVRFRGLPRRIHRGLRAFRHAQRRSTRPRRNRPERTRMRLEMRPRRASGGPACRRRLWISGPYGSGPLDPPPEIGMSAVRPRPWPLSEPQVIALVTCGFVRLGVRSPMTANGRETPGLTASCPELGNGYRCGAPLMRSGVGTSWSAGHDVYRPYPTR